MQMHDRIGSGTDCKKNKKQQILVTVTKDNMLWIDTIFR